jgi:hypothetical protein
LLKGVPGCIRLIHSISSLIPPTAFSTPTKVCVGVSTRIVLCLVFSIECARISLFSLRFTRHELHSPILAPNSAGSRHLWQASFVFLPRCIKEIHNSPNSNSPLSIAAFSRCSCVCVVVRYIKSYGCGGSVCKSTKITQLHCWKSVSCLVVCFKNSFVSSRKYAR